MAAAGVATGAMAWNAVPSCEAQSRCSEGRLPSAEARRGAEPCSSAQVQLQSAKQEWPAVASSPDAKAASAAGAGRWAAGAPAQGGGTPVSQRSAPSSKSKNSTGPAQAPTPARAGKGAGKGKGNGNARRAVNEPPRAAIGGQIAQLKEMGFSEKDAKQALAECVWDVNKALDLLFTRGAPMVGAGASDDAVFEPSIVANPKGVEAVAAREGKGGKGARPSSPAASKKASAAARSGGNSPIGHDFAEHSTTASTASTPRSAGFVEKSEKGAASAPSQPSSPQATALSGTGDAVARSEVDAVATVLDNVNVTVPVAEVEAVVGSTLPAEHLAAASPHLNEAKPVVEAKLEEDVVPATPAVENHAEALPSRQKRAERVERAWTAEGTQLDVKEGDFVLIWPGSLTEHGWIYAEAASDCHLAGWLPDCVLQKLPSHQRWMRASGTMEAVHETQLGLVEGSWFKVSVETRTPEGWAYAETMGPNESASHNSGDAPGAVQNCSQAGWVPVCGLEWTD